MFQIDRNALPLGETVQHSFERELASDPALLEPAVGMTDRTGFSLRGIGNDRSLPNFFLNHRTVASRLRISLLAERRQILSAA